MAEEAHPCPGCDAALLGAAEPGALPRALEGQPEVEPLPVRRWRCACGRAWVGDEGGPWRGELAQPVACAGCGYSLRGVPLEGACPECGHAVTDTLGRGFLQGGQLRPETWVGRDRHWRMVILWLAGIVEAVWLLERLGGWGWAAALAAIGIGGTAIARRRRRQSQPVFWPCLGWLLAVLAVCEGARFAWLHFR